MQQKRVNGLLVWAVLFAFGSMMIVKDTHYLFHHHHHHCCCETICVLDGEPLDGHHHHDHTSFLALDNSDDDCAICHFQVVKVPKPSYAAYLCPKATIHKIEILPIAHYPSSFAVSISPRAPPVC